MKFIQFSYKCTHVQVNQHSSSATETIPTHNTPPDSNPSSVSPPRTTSSASSASTTSRSPASTNDDDDEKIIHHIGPAKMNVGGVQFSNGGGNGYMQPVSRGKMSGLTFGRNGIVRNNGALPAGWNNRNIPKPDPSKGDNVGVQVGYRFGST